MSNTLDITSVLNSAIDIALNQHVVYRPAFAEMTGSVTAAILLERIRHYWNKKGKTSFYKFNADCDHALYREGDSWQEELGFSRYELNSARKKIATRIKQGDSRKEALSITDANGKLKPLEYIVIYWRDSDNVMWYEFNDALFKAHLLKSAADKAIKEANKSSEKANATSQHSQIPHSQILQHLGMLESSNTYGMQENSNTLNAEVPEVPTEKQKHILAPSSQIKILLDAMIAMASLIEDTESLEDEAVAVEEESQSTSEITDLPAEQRKNIPRKKESTDAIADADESVDDTDLDADDISKRQLNDQYQEVVRRALGSPGEPKQAGAWVGKYIKFLRGQWGADEKGAGQKTIDFQLTDEPMSPTEIIGMTVWYRQQYQQDTIPTTYETLRNRCDEFRALSDYDQRMVDAQTRLEKLTRDDQQTLEDTTPNVPYDYHNEPGPPDESDMEPWDWNEFMARKEADERELAHA